MRADDVVKTVNTVDNIVDAVNAIDNALDAGNSADNLADELKPDLFRNGAPDNPNLGLKTPDKLKTNGTWDIAPDANGNVGPGGGGLSTESDPGSTWNNPWKFPSGASVPDEIRVFQDTPLDNPNHWLWEPAREIPYNEFKQLLKQTVPNWIKIE